MNEANLTHAGKGREKGSQNKSTKALKEMILAALDRKGGVDYLELQAGLNPTAFLTLIGKVLPMTVAGDADSPLKIITEIRRTVIDPKHTDA